MSGRQETSSWRGADERRGGGGDGEGGGEIAGDERRKEAVSGGGIGNGRGPGRAMKGLFDPPRIRHRC